MRRVLASTLLTLAFTTAAGPAFAGAPHPSPRDRLGTASKSSTYGSGSRQARITAYTSGYTRDFACGFLLSYDCATVKDLHGSVAVRRIGSRATNPDLMKISMTAGFEGVGLSVGVMSPSGVALGFVDAGKVCRSPELESRRGAAYVSFSAPGEICKAKTAGWVSTITISTNGYYRYGSSWRVVTASYRRSVGGV